MLLDALQSPTGFTALISIIFGGLAGAIISAYFSKESEKRQLTVKILYDYMDKYSQIDGDCYEILQKPESLDHLANVNKIIYFGNWSETVAILIKRKYVDKKVLEEYGLIEKLEEFYKSVIATNNTSKCQPEEWVNLEKIRSL